MPVDRASVLSPGQAMNLTVHYERQISGPLGVWERFTSIGWWDMELPLSVTAMPDSDSLRVAMTVHRVRTGGSHTQGGETKHEESVGFVVGDPIQSERASWSHLRNAEFVAVIDPQGQLASTDVTGKHWADLKKEFAESARQDGAPQVQVDIALRGTTFGVFSALEDAMSYLPPEGLQAGQSWKVRREYVFPYVYFEFGMFTRGGLYSKEEATCTVRSVRARGPHSVATIAIRGKRIPHGRGRSMQQTVKHFDLKGELEVNLHTGAIEKLRLESVPALAGPGAYANFKVKLVQVITLKPA
jgi:hypothetical protein